MGAQQRGVETRMRILEAAKECFAQNGYDATGVAKICRRAGVTKGGFYHHFGSKQAVFLELLEQWLTGLDTQMDVIRTGSGNIPQGLLNMAGMTSMVFEAASGNLPMFLEYWSKASRDPEIWKATIAPYRQYQALFAHMIEEGIAEGSLHAVDPQTTARIIISLAFGLILQGMFNPDETDWGQTAQDGIQMLLEGIERK